MFRRKRGRPKLKHTPRPYKKLKHNTKSGILITEEVYLNLKNNSVILKQEAPHTFTNLTRTLRSAGILYDFTRKREVKALVFIDNTTVFLI